MNILPCSSPSTSSITRLYLRTKPKPFSLLSQQNTTTKRTQFPSNTKTTSPTQPRTITTTPSLRNVTDSTTTTTTTAPLSPPQLLPDQQELHIAHITRTGTMSHTVQLTRRVQKHDTHLRKHYTRPMRLLAHDPNPAGYLRTGDVVEYSAPTAAEVQARLDKKEARLQREMERAEARDAAENVPVAARKSAVQKLVRERERNAKERKTLGIKEKLGPKWVVRRVVTPFGVALDERVGELEKDAERLQGQNSLDAGKGGNRSKNVASSGVAG